MFFLTVSAARVSAQDIEAHKAEKARLEEEIALINRQLEANTSRQKDNTRQLQLIRRKINNRQSIVNEIDAQIRDYDLSITRTRQKINVMEDEMDTLVVYYERLVRGTEYKSTNIMDYAVSYSNTFTANQRERVRYILEKGAFVPGPKNREISNSTRTGSGELPHHVME